MRTIRASAVFLAAMFWVVSALAQSVPVSISPANLPVGVTGQAYSQNLAASGGAPPYSWFLGRASVMPPGLSFSSSGVISGTPTQAGSFSFEVFVLDSRLGSGSRIYRLNVINPRPPISVAPPALPNGTVGTAYSQTITASGGDGSFTFSVTFGALPAGLTLNSTTGVLSGTPTTAAASNFTITATDGFGDTGSRGYRVTIVSLLTLSPTNLPSGTVGSRYSQTISASGGSGSVAFAITSGSLPAGLTLNTSTGVLSGTPSAAGASTFTITATDSAQNSGARSYTVSVFDAVVLSPATLPNGTVGVAYSQTFSATGGTGSFTFGVSSGTLPAGLALSASTGALSGTPSAAGASTFTITASDSAQNSASRSYTVTIFSAVAISPATLLNGTVGSAYSQTISANGGTGTFGFSVTAGALPAGLTLNASTGVLSGTPTATATSTFTVTATDTAQNSASRSYTVSVFNAVVLSPPTLSSGAVGTAYSQTFSATGGGGSFTFAVSSGTLPAGLTLNAASGVLSGTPVAAAASTFTITATDTAQNSASRSYTVTIFSAASLAPASLPNGTIGTAYSQTISASGGSGSFTFAVSSGTLPAGLTLNATTGVLSGTPTTAATSTFTVTATDTAQNSASRSYTVAVFNAIALSPATLPNGIIGVAYSQTVSATGGTGSFTFNVSSGALPTGLTLNAGSGVLSGTPTTLATSNFTITATDTAQNSASRSYAMAIAKPTGTLQMVSGDKQVVPANAGVPVNLVVRVVDALGSPVAGAEVTWAVVQGAGTIANATTVSDTQGLVQAAYTTGPDAVDNLVRVAAAGSGSSFTFTVRNQQKAVVEPARQLVTPQSLLAITTPTIQLNNIRQRLDQLRLQRNPAVTDLLRLSVDGRPLPPMSAYSLAKLDHDGKPQRGGGASADKADPLERLGVFVNGDVNIGRQSAVDTQSGFKLRSNGLTLGTDYRLAGNHVLGAAIGFMRADTTLDGSAGRQDADGYSLSLFGSLVPLENAYIDGILNIGRNNYDSERRTANSSFNSSTSGSQWGFALNAGYAFNRGPLVLTPFARVEYVDAKVDAFTESGSVDGALAIGEQRLKATTLAIGGQVSYAISTSWGVLLPYGRLEYQHIANANSDDITARVAADTVSLPAQFQILGQDKNFGSFAVGVSAVFARGISGFASYEQQFARDNFTDQRYLLGIRAEF